MIEYYGYIYLTTNLINNKKYIGKRASRVFDRSYYGSGKILKKALNKYGKENFKVEILEWCLTLEDLNLAEKKWIKNCNAQESLEYYNISSGGDWGDISKGMTPEEKAAWGKKISEANTGKKRTQEQRKRISEALSGKPRHLSKEAIEKRKGKGNHRYGKKWSEEEREKLSECSGTKKQVEMFFKEKHLVFGSVNECFQYLRQEFGISKFLVKKILREGKPYHLNGGCKTQENLRKIEGLELRYIA